MHCKYVGVRMYKQAPSNTISKIQNDVSFVNIGVNKPFTSTLKVNLFLDAMKVLKNLVKLATNSSRRFTRVRLAYIQK